MNNETEQVFIWDFFGQTSVATARHFLKHLIDTGIAQEMPIHESGLFQEREDHAAAFVRFYTSGVSPEKLAGCEAFTKKMKPRRSCKAYEFHQAISDKLISLLL